MSPSEFNSSCKRSSQDALELMTFTSLNSSERSFWDSTDTLFLNMEKIFYFWKVACDCAVNIVQFCTPMLRNDILIMLALVYSMHYVYKTVLKCFNYTQDFDLPGVCQKRKDLVNLTRMLRKTGNKLPPPFPNGWYGVLESSELKNGAVKQVDCFGESLAVFRGVSGEAHVLDAHCPHLGANMAVGGSVRGDCLECPFHRWRFSGQSGKCVAIPGVDTIPKRASVRTWRSREIDGMIFAWYHSGDESPAWDIPSVPEIESRDWIYMGRNEFLIPCHLQDIPENGADLAHLNALHSDHLVAGKTLPTSEGYNILGRHVWGGEWSPSDVPHIASVKLHHDVKLFDKISAINIQVTAKQIGPSYVQMEIQHKMMTVVILQTVTPIAPLVQKVTHRLYGPICFKPFGNLMMWAETVMFHRDVMVWSSKEFVAQPLLVKTDKCLKAYRTWFKQFYSESSVSFEDALRNISSNNVDW